MKLELDINSLQNTPVSAYIHTSDSGSSEEVKKSLRLGIKLAKEGNRAEARQMLLGVTKADPSNETAWLWLASISEYPEELLIFLQNVLKINPENERAIEWAKQTKSLLSKTFVQRGISASQENQKEFAKQCFLQGIVHDDENEMAWLWLASSSDSQEEKVSHLQRVLFINPNNETALNSLNSLKTQVSQSVLKKASSAAISGDHETAREMLESVMKNTPNLEEAWILKAFLANDYYEKINCYEKTLEINPENEAAQAGLASLKSLTPKAKSGSHAVALPVVEESHVAEEAKSEGDTAAFEAETAHEVEAVATEETVEQSLAEEFVAEESEVAETEQLEFAAPEVSPEEIEEENLEMQKNFGDSEVESIDFQSQDEIAEEFELQAEADRSATQDVQENHGYFFGESVNHEHAAEKFEAKMPELFEDSIDSPTQDLDAEFAKQADAYFQTPNDGVSKAEETAAQETGWEASEAVNIEAQAQEEVFASENQESTDYYFAEEAEVANHDSVEAADFSYASEAETLNHDHSAEAASQDYEETVAEFSQPEAEAAADRYFEPAAESEYFASEEAEAAESMPMAEESNVGYSLVSLQNIEEVNEPSNDEVAAEQHVQPQLVQCPFCQARNEAQSVICNSCHAMVSLADMDMLLSHQSSKKELIEKGIERMEAEKSTRSLNPTELQNLGIAHLNVKNLRQGLAYLQTASQLNPNDVFLSSKVNSLASRLAEIEQTEHKAVIGKPTQSRTVLVVDDSPTVRKLISGKLEKCGHTVLAAVDGMDALAKINEIIPDLILLDITMPRLDGYQVCKLIRNNEMTKDVPIVMISGKDGFFDKVRGKMAGSSGYITKPFGPDTLMKTIESFLA